MIEFEWDEQKARQNLRKHGVSFEYATQAFRDPIGVEWLDDTQDYDEERSILLGLTAQGLLVIVHTDRSSAQSERIRLISARRATRDEQDYYYRENG